jgi:outer membrane protein assembly factor BamE (lipoprotein component of BamABCDE complex)
VSRFEQAWGNRGRLVVFLALILILAGCGTSIKFGRMPDTNSLTSLKQQVSTKGDVLNTLGPPRGYGSMRPYPYAGYYDLWFYEFSEAKGITASEIKVKMLLVFFDKDKYDGYMWFSALENLVER